MTDNVSNAEAEALLGSSASPQGARQEDVQPRDFRRPRRLGEVRLREVANTLRDTLPALSAPLGELVRGTCPASIEGVGEIGADMALEGLAEPFVALSFEVAGLTGWVVWECSAAIVAVSAGLGATALTDSQSAEGTDADGETDQDAEAEPEDDEEGGDDETAEPVVEPEVRALTRVESGIIGRTLARVATATCEALGLEIGETHILRTEEDVLRSLRSSALKDAHRTSVHLGLETSPVPSTLRLYIPGVEPRSASTHEADSSPPPALPDHLGVVPLQLGARLGCAEVPLRELLELEVGDVIPLGVTLGTPVNVTIGERSCASAEWGNHDGVQVLRLLDFEHPNEDD